ncbi:MAG: DUF2079 domain-containing protein [Chloroflexota bacterium]|nr:DUF2079 domain-containing protein [Chloroflexota bacterium]
MKNLVLFLGPALFIAAPWYLRSFYYVRNPVWPLLPEVFGYNALWSPGDMHEQLVDWHFKGIGRDLGALMTLPWNLAHFQGRFGNDPPLITIYFWLLPLSLFWAVKSPYIRALLALVASNYVLWFLSGAQIQRYVLPVLPMLVLATVTSMDRTVFSLPGIARVRRWTSSPAVAVIGFACFLAPGYVYAVDREMGKGPVPVSQEARDEYLGRYLPAYPVHKWLNELHGEDYTVYGFRDEDMAYFTDGTYAGSLFGPTRIQGVLDTLSSGQALHRYLQQFKPDYFLVAQHRGKIDLPDDEHFRAHFKLVYESDDVKLFRVEEGQPRQ